MASDEGDATWSDISKKFKARSEERAEKTAEEKAERRILRQKIIGVLIKKARQDSGKSLKETAAVLGCSPDRLSQYESGEKSPSLSEVEMLARFFSVPLEELLDETRQPEAAAPLPPSEVVAVRDKIIGVLLRQARQAAGLNQKELAEAVNCSVGLLSQYEQGKKSIPLPELEALTEALGLRFTELVDDDLGPNSPEAHQQRKLERLAEMPEYIQEFVLNPVNALYIEMAMKVSTLPVDTLRRIAEGLLDITY
jgi:transcriptional regulator with XRE-family HTH domain